MMKETKKTTVKAESAAVKKAVKTEAAKVESAVKSVAEKTAPVVKAAVEKAAPVAKAATAKAETAKRTVKETAKKTATKTTAKKAAAKKTEATAAVTLQFSGKSYTTEDLVKIARDVWEYDLNGKVEAFKSVELFVKPEENTVYYVINGEVRGSFGI